MFLSLLKLICEEEAFLQENKGLSLSPGTELFQITLPPAPPHLCHVRN